MRQIEKIIVHCTDSPHEINDKVIGAATIRLWHTQPPPQGRGWNDIGYHAVIDKFGRIEQGRLDEVKGAHAEGHNHDSIGVVLVGKEMFYPAQIVALKKYVLEKMKQYGIPKEGVLCHYQVNPGKTCPNIKREELEVILFGDEKQ